MAVVPLLSRENPGVDSGGYRSSQLPSLLPQMQAGGIDRPKAISYNAIEEARRKDAELNLMRNQIRSASFLVNQPGQRRKHE